MKKYIILDFLLSSALIINSFAQQPGWEIIPSGTTEELNSIYFYDYETGYACGNSGVVIKSVDSGKTWQSLQSPVSSNLNDIFVFPQECFIAVGDSATFVGTWDGGDSMYVFRSEYNKNIYSVSFSGDQGVFNGIFGSDSQKIIIGRTTYCGTVIYDIIRGSSNGVFWDACMISPVIGFVAGENSIFQPLLGRTTNFGNNWDFISFYLNGENGKATGVSFTDSLVGYISARVWDGRGAIARTINSGYDWTTKFFCNPLWSINFPITGSNKVGYCVGDSGTILKTSNAGETWHTQSSGTSEKLNKVHFLDSDFGFAVGDNGVILRTTNGGGSISSIEKINNYLYSFELHQNYPNPFNPSTKIKYQIPEISFVSIKVYDVLGKEIATLVNKEKPSGSYEVNFDAKGLPSGIYFYQLNAGNFTEAKKMILLR